MERLYKKLESYGQSDYYPFHMPGHKRNKASSAGEFPFERDITEISGFDYAVVFTDMKKFFPAMSGALDVKQIYDIENWQEVLKF